MTDDPAPLGNGLDRPARQPPNPGTMEPPSPVKILVVDDEPSKLLAIQVVLEELDQEVVTASSGREALRKLLHEDFAVILLDVNMPDVDGFETAALIRQRSRSEHVPIIFITSYHDDARALQSYSLGAVDYIMTPFVPEILRAKVRVFVDLFRMQQQVTRQAEERIALAEEQTARVAAEKANRAKSEFLANVSHELRTPMNAIIGMTELALDEELPPAARDYLSTARTSAYVLLGLLNEILDLSRLESGKFELESIPFPLHEVVDQTVKALAVRAYEKGVECSCVITGRTPRSAIGDPLRVRQVLMNLLGNAIKFTHQGEVVLRVDAAPLVRGRLELRCCVSDTGIGISLADQQRIFAPFTQADSSMTRSYGGTGLGLAIASDLIGRMNGRIWLESEPLHGSRFHFTLQLAADRAAQEPPAEAPLPTAGTPVLLFDSSPLQRAALEETLRDWSLAPQSFGNREEFLSELERGAAKPPAALPVVIVSWPIGDASLPELLEKTLAFDGVWPVVVMISAADRQSHAGWLNGRRGLRCIEKPVMRGELRAAVSRVTAPPAALRPPSGPAVNRRPPRALRILVAEDTPANQKLLTAALTKHGHLVQLARDGREAVALAQAQRFDVILMDVQMPVMDGLQATAAIRESAVEACRNVPIIAMTAHAMEGDRERFLGAGMDDYLAKPIHVPRLIEFLEGRYTQRPANGETSGPAAASNAGVASVSPTQSPLNDEA